MKWRWLPWLRTRDIGRDAIDAKREATRKLNETLAQRPAVDALAERLNTQLHRRNQISKLFDEAFRGAK